MAIFSGEQAAWMEWAAKEAEAGRCRCDKCSAKLIGAWHLCKCGGRACFAPKGVLLIEDERPYEPENL